MNRIFMLGFVCLMLVCPLADEGRAVAVCNSSALAALDNGVGRLLADTMDIDAALADFSSAISFDGTCSPAYVARAMVRVAQIYDTTAVKNLRLAFGDTKTYALMMTDTHPHGDHQYIYDADTMDADDFQGALGGPVLTLLNSALSDLILVENGSDTAWQMDVPGRFISDNKLDQAKKFEVDIADVYAMHSVIQAAKAAIYIATSYNFNAGRDWRHFKDAERDGLPDGDTFLRHIQDTITTTSFFTLRNGATGTSPSDSFNMARSLIQSGDSLAFRFFALVKDETNVDFTQDTELFPYIGPGRKMDTAVWDFVNETDVADYNDPTDGLHFDTLPKIYNGGTVLEDLKKENDDLGVATLRPGAFLDTPLTRATFPSVSAIQHGFEFNESYFSISNLFLGGALPGATNNDIFLLAHEVDTYFIVTAPNTLVDLTTLSKPPGEVDVKFNLSTSGPVRIRQSSNGFDRMLVVTPQAGVSPHLRIFYNRDENFTQTEKAKMRGDIDSSLIYIVPWAMSGGHAVEAGLSNSAFQSNFVLSSATTNDLYETMTFSGPSTQFDTIVPFRFGSDLDASNFNPILSSNVQSLPLKLKVGITLNRFGFFLLAEQAPFFKRVQGFLEGDTGEPLEDSFIVKVTNGFGVPVSGVEVTFNLPGTSDRPTDASQGSFDSPVQTSGALGLVQTNYRMGDKPGVYKITVTANGFGNALVFAFTTGYTPHPGGVWRMISMPVFPSLTLPPATGETFSMCNLGMARLGPKSNVSNFIDDDFSSYKVFYWDPSYDNPTTGFTGEGHRRYRELGPTSAIQMGKAYWLKTTAGGVLDAVNRNNSNNEYSEIDEDGTPETVVLQLHAGWNQIATPYSFSVLSKDLYVDTDNDGFSLLIDSIPTSFITHQLYWIGPTNSANPGSGYSQGPGTAHPEVGLFPFGGYWINANQACTLVFPPAGGGPANGEITSGGGTPAPPYILMSAPGLTRSSTDWTVQLYVQTAGGVDYENFAGVRPLTSKAPSYYEPPLAPGGVSLSFVDGQKKYSQHLRMAGEIPTWEVEVQSVAAGPVTINASNVASVPDQMPVMLRDETTGDVVNLRAGSYTYNSNPDEKRQFTFAAATLAPGTGNGFFTKVVQPQVCVMARISVPGTLDVMRSLRDLLLGSKLGRAWVSLYYALFSF